LILSYQVLVAAYLLTMYGNKNSRNNHPLQGAFIK
jgi:hypothetical protein